MLLVRIEKKDIGEFNSEFDLLAVNKDNSELIISCNDGIVIEVGEVVEDIPYSFNQVCLPSKFGKKINKAQYIKLKSRFEIRNTKDIEDDIKDLKILVQGLARVQGDLWFNVLTDEQKELAVFKDFNNALFSHILNVEENPLRIDVEGNILEKLLSIFDDEKKYADIVKKNKEL